MTRGLVDTLLLLLLIGLNGILAASEAALLASRRARLRRAAREGRRGAARALALSESPETFLATVQIGITLVGVVAGAFGGARLAEELAPLVARAEPLRPWAYELALGAVVLAITYLSLVLGELVPKQIAMRTPEAIAAAMAAPLHALSKVAAPAVRLLGGSSRLVLRTLGLRPHAEPSVSPEELRLMIQEGTQHGVFRPEQGRLLERVLHLGDRPVATLMILRSEIVWLDLLATPEVNRARLESAPHHHLPVCRGRLEELVGMVSLKSVWVGGDEALHDLSALARPPLFVPATTNGIRLLERFRESGERAALVLDEYGGIAGLASLNELTEALLGELASLEEVPAEAMTYRRPDGSWSVDGSLTLRELTDLLELASPASEPARTVGGLAMHTLARIPAVGDRFQALGADFEIVDMDGRRVDRLLVRPLPPTD